MPLSLSFFLFFIFFSKFIHLFSFLFSFSHYFLLNPYLTSMALRTVDESKDGSTISVKKGETFRIQLPGNPTTGYTWTREGKKDMTSSSCELLDVKGSYQQKSGGGMMMGSGGMFVFDVTAKEEGAHPLTLVYTRPWETNASPNKKFFIQIDCIA